MPQDVDARDVHRAERRAFRPAERRSGDRVDLLDRVVTRRERAQRLDDAVQPDVVGDEVRRVLRDDDALAEREIREAGDARDDRRVRVGRRNHFEQSQIPRRVEEVRADPVPPEIVAPALAERGDGNTRRVGAHDRPAASGAIDPLAHNDGADAGGVAHRRR